MIAGSWVIREEPHLRAGDGKIMIRIVDGGRDDKHRGESRRRKGEVMKKILSMILAVMMALGLTITAYASEVSEVSEASETSESSEASEPTEVSEASEVTLDDIVAQIRAFEEAHPEMEEQFPQIIQDVTGIATEEFRAAFSQIQDQFEEMLEADRQKNVTDADHEAMREKLDTQASLINAGFLARLKVAEEQMIAALRGQENTEGETAVIDVLEKLVAEKTDDAHLSELTAKLSQIVEKAKAEYNGDLDAWYKEVSAVPELQPGDAGNESRLPPPEPQEGDASRPPMPEGVEGEQKPPEGEPGEGGIPFNDHFTVIQEGLSGAFSRINERLQALATSEKYQNSGATEAFDLLHKLYSMVNDQMMEQLRNMDKMTRDSMMNTP